MNTKPIKRTLLTITLTTIGLTIAPFYLPKKIWQYLKLIETINNTITNYAQDGWQDPINKTRHKQIRQWIINNGQYDRSTFTYRKATDLYLDIFDAYQHTKPQPYPTDTTT